MWILTILITALYGNQAPASIDMIEVGNSYSTCTTIGKNITRDIKLHTGHKASVQYICTYRAPDIK